MLFAQNSEFFSFVFILLFVKSDADSYIARSIWSIGYFTTCVRYYCNEYYVHRVYFISDNKITLTAWREITLIAELDTSSVTSRFFLQKS